MSIIEKNLKDRLLRLKSGLQANEEHYCGMAPSWIVERVLTVLNKIDLDCDDGQLKDRIASFALGGIRFVSDQGSSDCDVLLNVFGDLLGTN